MDVQHLLCGIGAEKLRNLGLFKMPSLPRPLPWRDAVGAVDYPVASSRSVKPCRRHLPVGTGPFTVGCVDLMSGHTVEGVFIRLYYPTNPTDIYQREAQWPLWLPHKQYGKGYAYFRRKNTKVYGRLLNKLGGDVYVPVLWQAPVLGNRRKFPVIIFSHGLGGNRTTYTTICSDLASHGYIVAAVEHRDGSASMTFCLDPTNTEEQTTLDRNRDYRYLYRNYSFREEKWLKYERQEVEDDFDIRNKQVHMRVNEVQRVLDLIKDMNQGQKVENVLGANFDFTQFKGVCDLSRVTMMGHSFGGSTTIATLAADKRFRVGVALDTWMMPLDEAVYPKVTQPLLMVNTEAFQWPENVRPMYKLGMNSEDNLTKRILITLRGTCHQSQTDFQFCVPGSLGKFLGLRYTTEPVVAIDLNQRAARGFLAKHLHIPGEDLNEDVLSGRHDLVILGTNLDLQSNNPPGPGR